MNGVLIAGLDERVAYGEACGTGYRTWTSPCRSSLLEKRGGFPIGCRYHSLIPKGVAGIILHERRVEKSSFSQRASSDD
ncbi:hypothetical protein TYRP_010074 [Tyrophagus putrescentiae]|nr:hypothetical protein TYRP_010074 [Tyrophagus putrescentiae]